MFLLRAPGQVVTVRREKPSNIIGLIVPKGALGFQDRSPRRCSKRLRRANVPCILAFPSWNPQGSAGPLSFIPFVKKTQAYLGMARWHSAQIGSQIFSKRQLKQIMGSCQRSGLLRTSCVAVSMQASLQHTQGSKKGYHKSPGDSKVEKLSYEN